MSGYVYLDVNPEPWAVGPLSLGRRGGKMFPKMERNASVFSFKEAVRGELKDRIQGMPPGVYDLDFYLWRRLESYIGESGRKATAHVADATNMQKALEDALQGILFDNDRDVRRIRSEIVEQGPDVVPGIAIYATEYVAREFPIAQIRLDREGALLRAANPLQGGNNTWPPS